MNASEIALLGRVSAGVTHEMKNVLAIIKECGGLAQDILDSGRDREKKLREKLERALSTIASQMSRAEEITGRMNRLAHTMDEEPGTIDVTDLASLAAFLARRGARSKNVSLVVTDESASGVAVGPHPTRLVLLICAFIERCVEQAEAGDTLVIEADRQDDRPVVRVGRQAGADQAATARPVTPALDDLPALAAELGCEFTGADAPDCRAASLLLPGPA